MFQDFNIKPYLNKKPPNDNSITNGRRYNLRKLSNEFETNRHTVHCLPYKAPNRVINNNYVEYPSVKTHSWSNTRGYGNIVLATNDSCNNIHGKVKPWNRIESLNCPYNTPVDVSMAWNVNKVQAKRN